jgi:hypothetical protein
VSISDSLLPICIMFSRFIHIVVHLRISFLFKTMNWNNIPMSVQIQGPYLWSYYGSDMKCPSKRLMFQRIGL